jgi:hypothetical protein
MPKSTEVFTPNDVPTFSYVERKARRFEERLRESLSIPKMIVSLSGPSKSGKVPSRRWLELGWRSLRVVQPK